MKTLTLTGLTLAATLGFSALATGASAQGLIGGIVDTMPPPPRDYTDCFPSPTWEELLGLPRVVAPPPAPDCRLAYVLNAYGQLEPAGMLCRPAPNPEPTTGGDIIWD